MPLRIEEKCFFSEMNRKYKTIEEKITELQSSESKTEINIHQAFSDFYDQKKYFRQSRTFHVDEDPVSENAQGTPMNLQEALLLLKLHRTKTRTENNTMRYFELYYSIVLSLSDGGEH